MEARADLALIGLAVMGQNLILNMNDHGFTIVAYNRSTDKVDRFLANEAKGTRVIGAHSIAEMVALLKKPRRVMMLVKAGQPVDDFIEQLIPHLEKGDIIIQIAEENIKNMDDFNKALASTKGKKTLVWVNRGGLFQGLVIK